MNKSQLLTECEICLDDMVEPRTLLCGHTYCKACLQQIIDSANNLVCPKDRKVFNVPDGNADNLTRNYYLEDVLENVRANRTASIATVTCVNHADKPAEVFCESCLKSVCSICMLKHNGHELSEYSDSRDKCALRLQQLQADVSKYKQTVDDANTAVTSAVKAQVAACEHNVDAAVNKIRAIVQVLNATANGLQSKTAQCQQLIQRAFRVVDFEGLQREVAALSKAALRFADIDTASNCQLETRFQQVDELTQKLEVQRGKLASVTSASVPDVSGWFSGNELTRSLETVLDYAMKLKQNVTSDRHDYLSLQQLNAALNEATTCALTSTSAFSTPKASFSQTNSQPLAVQLAAASKAALALQLLAKAIPVEMSQQVQQQLELQQKRQEVEQQRQQLEQLRQQRIQKLQQLEQRQQECQQIVQKRQQSVQEGQQRVKEAQQKVKELEQVVEQRQQECQQIVQKRQQSVQEGQQRIKELEQVVEQRQQKWQQLEQQHQQAIQNLRQVEEQRQQRQQLQQKPDADE